MTQTIPTTRTRGAASRGFTLVEILVVIGVISLLISILLPSINAAQRSAQRVACAANLRTIGQAYTLYTGESKGWYPHVNTDLFPNGPWGRPEVGAPPLVGKPDGIAIVVSQGYLPDPRVLYCPGGERTRPEDNTTHSAGNKNGTGIDNLRFWTQAKQTGVWDPGPGAAGLHQTGYAIWVNWADHFPDSDIRANWFAAGLKDTAWRGTERVLATDHMMRGNDDFEAWNGHLLKRRKIVGTQSVSGFPSDPNPDVTVNFEGGNVLYNDGHVVWKGTTDTVWRFRHNITGFDAFW